MGKAGNNSILKGLRGKIGPVSITGGQSPDIVRIRPSKSKRKASPKSDTQHGKFILVGGFFHTLST